MVHWRYSPQDCSTTHGGLDEASMESIKQLQRSSANGLAGVYLGQSFQPLASCAFVAHCIILEEV